MYRLKVCLNVTTFTLQFLSFFQCHTDCTEMYEIPEILNFTTPESPLPISVRSGQHYQLTCENPQHVVNDTWQNNFINVKCMHSGEFEPFDDG